MTESFEASNGTIITTESDPPAYSIDTPTRTVRLGPHQMEALTEFVRMREDERLGRWRWPENPDYVFYATSQGCRIIRESTGEYFSWNRAWLTDERIMQNETADAARAYFDAHPEPKPWHKAQTGEFWELWLNDSTVRLKAVAGSRDGQRGFNAEHGAFYALDDAKISHAKKVWPQSITINQFIQPGDTS